MGRQWRPACRIQIKKSWSGSVCWLLQVCVLYCGVKGYLDVVDPKEISRFESLFIDFINANHQDILRTIET